MPVDANGTPFVSNGSPLGPALKQYTRENGVASSVITVQAATTVVEVAAGGAPAFIKWVATGDTTASVIAIAGATANYDDVVPAQDSRVFPIPQERIGTASTVGANVQHGLYARYAIITGGISSVFAVEF